jgi:hypothetical protein
MRARARLITTEISTTYCDVSREHPIASVSTLGAVRHAWSFVTHVPTLLGGAAGKTPLVVAAPLQTRRASLADAFSFYCSLDHDH